MNGQVQNLGGYVGGVFSSTVIPSKKNQESADFLALVTNSENSDGYNFGYLAHSEHASSKSANEMDIELEVSHDFKWYSTHKMSYVHRDFSGRETSVSSSASHYSLSNSATGFDVGLKYREIASLISTNVESVQITSSRAKVHLNTDIQGKRAESLKNRISGLVQLPETSKVTVLRTGEVLNIYIRDKFSSDTELKEYGVSLMKKLNLKNSKLFINGAEV